jgi:hypothetical protein
MAAEGSSFALTLLDPLKRRSSHRPGAVTVRIGKALGEPPGCHNIIWEGTDSRFLARGEDKVVNPRAKDDLEGTSDHARSETRQWSGAMSHTLFGNLNGVYTLSCDDVPSEGEIREALHLRVVRDCGRPGKQDRDTVLTAWHGGWTREGIGIFSADICGSSRKNCALDIWAKLASKCGPPGIPDRAPGMEWPIEPSMGSDAQLVQK